MEPVKCIVQTFPDKIRIRIEDTTIDNRLKHTMLTQAQNPLPTRYVTEASTT